ncbi:MAG: hypothetical protein COV76_06445 [Candidatus Omnitrophica bacterium CG11_big_fil_rev_8_21_14_0_20_64_10]|nr:MAG: hypothetical protein COV76_06445 [Candidatus Omnitrophica bacterium CG11_big_fil_rev_8_21_14_0_20_64_10]
MLGLVLGLTGCAHPGVYSSGKMPSNRIADYPEAREAEGVRFAVRRYEGEAARQVVGFPLEAHGIQPVFLTIRNKSSRSYWFDKKRVSPRPIPARRILETFRAPESPKEPDPDHVPTSSAEQHLEILGHRWEESRPGSGWKGAAFAAFPYMLPKVIREDSQGAGWNRDFARDLVGKEIPDGRIIPGRTWAGVVYLPMDRRGEPVRIELTGRALPLLLESDG